MTDIVTRLRSYIAADGGDMADIVEAADEIERLRAAPAMPAPSEDPATIYKRGYEEALNDCIRNGVQWARSMFANNAEHIAPTEPEGDIVVTRSEDGQIVAVTRQDEEGRILSVIAESAQPAAQPLTPLTDEEIVDIWAGVTSGYDDTINIIELGRAIEAAHGIKGDA